MNPDIAKLLNAILPAALGVAAGTVPLIGVIAWFAFQQGDRFRAIEGRMDRIESRMDRLEAKIDRLESKVDKLIEVVNTLATEVAILKVKVDGPCLVQPI